MLPLFLIGFMDLKFDEYIGLNLRDNFYILISVIK